MADTYEKDLAQKSSLTTSDYIRVVGSDNVSYKQGMRSTIDSIFANSATQITNTDLNTLTTATMIYYAAGDHGCTNVPENISSFGLIVLKVSAGYRAQICIGSNANIYIRRYTGSSWNNWVKVTTQAV